ncbi:MAG: hypothetical protein BGO21_21175 [Dyadobacter sp. 50-39]|nr:MAG: hypothetical protein BGO21_21175 [Dyadobacter sp. 50-39]
MNGQPLLPKHTKTLFETEGRKAMSYKSKQVITPVFAYAKNLITNFRKTERNGSHDLSEG